MAYVTFIVPSLGRITLERALESLQQQTDGDWEAVVVCDGWERTYEGSLDPRMTWIGCSKQDGAGPVRNYGIAWALRPPEDPPEWIAFLDDDDVLGPLYVEHLRKLDSPQVDVVVARMADPRLGILPSIENPRLAHGQVGISYAVRTSVMCKHAFVTEDRHRAFNEDWELLSELIKHDRQIHISPYIDYIVRPHEQAGR